MYHSTIITVPIIIHILSFSITNSRILLYTTENNQIVGKFDCIYDTHYPGEEIPYCQRPNGTFTLMRQQTQCENQGKKRSFRHLLDENIQPNEVLNWSSSVEMADLYASIYYNRSLINDNNDLFLCQCTELGTFGKFCEYRLTHDQIKFSDAIKVQFDQKKMGDSWNTQRYGAILCYQTLPCESSPLCLDWREICDGVQRCSNGIDEENCDKLEFNECEDDEYRCTNGMCIAEEFWFDGEQDCMDWTDEYFVDYGDECPFTPNTMACDEHLCSTHRYSCGDGECVRWQSRMTFSRGIKPEIDCFNKRNLNYMCEMGPHRRSWTLENGLCWPDEDYDDPRYPPWNLINVFNLTNKEKCEYLFRCLASDNFEHHCPCDHLNCRQMMINVCLDYDQLIVYPPRGLINANILIFYKYLEYERNTDFHLFILNDNVKCQGYLVQAKVLLSYSGPVILGIPFVNQVLCSETDPNIIHRNLTSRSQYNKLCWNGSLTFNNRPYGVIPDLCTLSGQCVSQYRIHDGLYNCVYGEDEDIVLKKSFCTGNAGRQRFQCYNNQHKCLTSQELGTGISKCLNNYDESWYGNGLPLREHYRCHTDRPANCHRVKDYVQQSSDQNLTRNHSIVQFQTQDQTNRIAFRSYCDSFWDSDSQMDEKSSSCQQWICPSDQYQCQTGQCIRFNWLCDGEWDCADASDEEATMFIQQWSLHNIHLTNFSIQLDKCRQRYSQSPFSNFCNSSFEFGCLRSGVLNPLDVQSHRPCINFTQIADGKEDCYNAYDEKNLFEAKSNVAGMWGFHFQCGNNHRVYTDVCTSKKEENCTDILCSIYQDTNESCSDVQDFFCLEDHQCKKNARCNNRTDCSYGEDEYWCPSGSLMNQLRYRFNKIVISKQQSLDLFSIRYPKLSLVTKTEEKALNSVINLRNDQLFQNYSYLCNRGISVIERNEIRCLCPPSYYGNRCQFFSDRLSVIVHLDRKTLPKSIHNCTLKIQADFLFKKIVIDQHEFHLSPILERDKIIKHKFYFLYSHSSSTIEHKQNRYLNRTDIISNHPYSIHFLLFALHQNNRPEELGTWHYPIYFDYLPAFRLAVVLKFSFLFQHSLSNHCRQNNCNDHSTCLPILNQNNSFYCSCQSGYYGVNCTMYEPLCNTSCAPNSFCQPNKESKPHCVCPLGHFGTHCNLKYDQCDQNSCQNNGTCHSSFDPSGEEPFFCMCSNRFYGNRCQYEKVSVRIQLNIATTFFPRATVIQLYDILFPYLTLQIKHQKVHEGLPLMITFYHSDDQAPPLGVLKIYKDSSDLQYLVMYVLNGSVINITSSPHHCPDVSLLSFKDTDQSVPIVFQYHQICQNDTQRFCLYDENYFCLCKSNDFRAECFLHNPQLDHCDKCLSGGKCLQGDPTDSNDFFCLCPSCHQGHRCQFNLQPFGFTFDSLLVRYSTSMKIVYLSLILLLLMVGFLNNFCSFITFKRPTPRRYATGTYLLIIACLNQLALFCLFLKFIQITFGISSVVSCRLVSYLLSVLTRSTYWLTSWVTVDRILIILYPNSPRLKDAHLAIRLSVATLIILLAMHIHETIYYTAIEDHHTSSPICVIDLGTRFVSVYNQMSTPIHYILPFLIQTISITLLIVFSTRSRVRATGQRSSFYQALKTQFENQKELYVTPLLVIFSILPQAITTFSLACKDLNEGQRNLLLYAYLLSHAPQVLGFILYVLPSTSYKKEFGQTLIGKKYFRWMLEKGKTETVIPKTK